MIKCNYSVATVKVLNSYDKVNNLMCIFEILGRE